MDDLDGLFSSPATPTMMSPGPQTQGFPPPNNVPSPVTQLGVNFPNNGFQSQHMPGPVQGMPGHQVPMMPGQQVPMMPGQQQPPGALMMTPTQTQAASQLNNKTQILNQFQTPPQTPALGGMMPPRPAPGIPGQQQQQQQQQMPQQFVQQQQPPPQQDAGFGDGFMQSLCVTEPMPQEFDDMFSGHQSGADALDGGQAQGSTFFDDSSNQNQPQAEVKPVEEVKQEEGQHQDGDQGNEAAGEQPERKTSFWSGLWNRSKDHGSKENMLEEAGTEKKEPDDGRGGNEQKFVGDGQVFKGKLIGVLEVKEARGDRMCQDALQELKMAIKASGEHKQRVNIQIAVDGLKIRDEKSGDCLYHHPVHKISFIAQDMTDNRAFGYVYGSPENGHRFFGIKTEKAAGQVVVAMRDLFQVVFEMKKKEIDEAKQNMESGSTSLVSDAAAPKVTGGATAVSFPDIGGGATSLPTPAVSGAKVNAIDDLLGLETELSAIQAGIQQIDKIADRPPMSFETGSMMPLSLSNNAAAAPPPVMIQPPVSAAPASARKPVAVMSQNPPAAAEFGTAPFLPPPPTHPKKQEPAIMGGGDRYAALESYNHNNNILQQQQSNTGAAFGNAFLDEASGASSIFSQGSSFGDPMSAPGSGPASLQTQNSGMFGPGPSQQQQQQFQQQPQQRPNMGVPPKSSDLDSLFTDLDPLGTGMSKPFVDKKDFFTASKKAPRLTGASDDSLNNKSEPMMMEDVGTEGASAASESGNFNDLI